MNYYFAAFLPESDGYSVLFPDLPGLQTMGDDLQDAYRMAVDALMGHLQVLADDNDPIPEPSDQAGAVEKLRALARQCEIELPDEVQLMYVPGPELDSTLVRVSVSFKRYVLDIIDRKAEARGMTRSGFLAEAAATYQRPGDVLGERGQDKA